MRIYIDLDGVLVDFINPWMKLYGFEPPRPWPAGEWQLSKIFPIDKNALWHRCTAEWWEHLEPTVEARLIIEMAERYTKNLYLVTNPPTYAAAQGKLAWINRYLPDFNDRYLITPCREILADDDSFLIDDYEKNIDLFNLGGGRGLLLARPWNRGYSQSNQSLDNLSTRLGYCVDAWKHCMNSAIDRPWNL